MMPTITGAAAVFAQLDEWAPWGSNPQPTESRSVVPVTPHWHLTVPTSRGDARRGLLSLLVAAGPVLWIGMGKAWRRSLRSLRGHRADKLAARYDGCSRLRPRDETSLLDQRLARACAGGPAGTVLLVCRHW